MESAWTGSIIVGGYIAWVLVFIGLQSGFDELWCAMVALTIAALALSVPVTAAHDQEPVCFPWHVPRIWSLHEDFHLCLFFADVAWISGARRFAASEA